MLGTGPKPSKDGDVGVQYPSECMALTNSDGDKWLPDQQGRQSTHPTLGSATQFESFGILTIY